MLKPPRQSGPDAVEFVPPEERSLEYGKYPARRA
jgi:hypothetical protein